MSHPIQGVLPILHTPLTADDEIDVPSLKAQIDWAFEVGADGVCTGMVSEILRLTEEERIALHGQIADLTNGRGPVIASIGAESIKGAIRYGKAAKAAGCTAAMAIPPINAALPEVALWEYFTAIADQVDLPIIVQDASSYVGQAIPISFYVRLLDHYSPDKILFKPEASPVGPNLSALRDATNGRAQVFDGSGGMLLIDAHRRGITGTMPGTDLLDAVVQLWKALEAGNQAAINRLSGPICGIVALQLQAGLDGFLAIEKYLMAKRGLFASDRRRAPYGWRLDQETRDYVDQLFGDLQASLQTN